MAFRTESNIDSVSVACEAAHYLIFPILGFFSVFFLAGAFSRVRVWISAIKMVLQLLGISIPGSHYH
ncbi:hypothetical protein AOQ84DRAFT_353719 [Glonium stellatum]|uniref:Uncharacterized protein n=1 Tax=Glonium stellatum TaxID=574774 RepID=A0A8E2F3V8_9PEZI|nr:hypothetical protein AOQ84DRAFT_353719 [Glonium stellatum]